MDHSGPVVGLDQSADAFPAQPPYQLDYAKWYAALSGHNDGRSRDAGDIAAPSVGPRELLISEAEAA
jgi:hypothetical protein